MIIYASNYVHAQIYSSFVIQQMKRRKSNPLTITTFLVSVTDGSIAVVLQEIVAMGIC